jgi:hypothetical protein
MTQSTIDFLLSNNVTIIQIVFCVIFVLVVFVILKSFKEEKEEASNYAPQSSSKQNQNEALLVDDTPGSAPAKDDGPLDDLDNLDDLMSMDPKAEVFQMSGLPQIADEELTQALSEKEKVITDLKNEIAALQAQPAPAKGGGGSPELESKVKELSDKLSEYEIIEDDIANLSFYKNENIKLKNELEKLKGMSGGKMNAPVEEVPPPVEVAAPTPAAPAPVDVLNEFEEAVKQKEAIEKYQTATPPSGPISIKSDSDLLKEFENVVDKELGGVESPKPTPPPVASAAPAPQEDINPKKLVEELEAISQEKPKAAAKDDDSDGDSNQKLIEEFENFVNKG